MRRPGIALTDSAIAPSPEVLHQHLFPADQLTSSGLAHPTSGQLHSVVGGTGRYFGARGEVFASVIGSNITGFPNGVLDFRLEKRDG